jgi:hypothetical protein
MAGAVKTPNIKPANSREALIADQAGVQVSRCESEKVHEALG